jgi:hypothetical protein
MNPYMRLGTGIATPAAVSLSARLAAWHDAMVAHERSLRSWRAGGACDDECPHAEARSLWAEALATFGARAHELEFLRSRATSTSREGAARSAIRRLANDRPAGSAQIRSGRSRAATLEVEL